MSIAEIIPLIQLLKHDEKLYLMAFLLSEIAQEDSTNLGQNGLINIDPVDALTTLASIAQPIGPTDLARNFDRYTGKILVDNE